MLVAVCPPFIQGVLLHPADTAGAVRFVINNFGSGVDGSFRGLKGRIDFNPENLARSSLRVSIDAATIETGIAMRNRHLRGEKYFHVEKFPEIILEGSNFRTSEGQDTYTMTARLTMKGITKSFPLLFKARPQKNGFLFEGSFKLNRRDYGIGSGSLTLADEVTVKLKVIAEH